MCQPPLPLASLRSQPRASCGALWRVSGPASPAAASAAKNWRGSRTRRAAAGAVPMSGKRAAPCSSRAKSHSKSLPATQPTTPGSRATRSSAASVRAASRRPVCAVPSPPMGSHWRTARRVSRSPKQSSAMVSKPSRDAASASSRAERAATTRVGLGGGSPGTRLLQGRELREPRELREVREVREVRAPGRRRRHGPGGLWHTLHRPAALALHRAAVRTAPCPGRRRTDPQHTPHLGAAAHIKRLLRQALRAPLRVLRQSSNRPACRTFACAPAGGAGSGISRRRWRAHRCPPPCPAGACRCP